MGAAVPGNLLGVHTAEIAHSAAAVIGGVGVDPLAPETIARNPDTIPGAGFRSEVAHGDYRGIVFETVTQERQHTVFMVVHLDPLEARGLAIAAVQGGRIAIGAVEVADQVLDAAVFRLLEQVPIEAVVMVPLAVLRELAAHEQQLLAWVRPHESEVRAQVGESLPAVPRHLAEQRTLAVHDLVV